jgi:PIN domain nuclease of toxin-antitoxin system
MVLLDTCAVIWMVQEAPITAAALSAIRRASVMGGLLISPVFAWEVGLLATRRRQPLTFRPNPILWVERLLTRPGIRPVPLSHETALSAAFLPGELHGDPADRLLIATARELGVPLLTRDRRILDYAGQGHVDAIAC